MKYRAIKKNGYGECVSNDIQYIADHVDEWCGPYFDLYIDGVLVSNPQKYLEPYKKRTPVTLEEKIVDMCYKIDHLKEIIKEAREYNNQIIKDTKDFYRPTKDVIYSGDTLIDLAETNIQILDKVKEI